jgi:aryl-alcohol dehydrogenase-like predicted oxidoreductase
MLQVAESNGYKPAMVAQLMYNLVARGIEQEFLPMALHFGLSTIAYNPLAGGLLTGKHSGEIPAPGSRFENNRVYRQRYWQPPLLRAAASLAKIACSIGRSPISLALNWLQHHTSIQCIVLGATHPGQLASSLCAMEEGPLPREAVEACECGRASGG